MCATDVSAHAGQAYLKTRRRSGARFRDSNGLQRGQDEQMNHTRYRIESDEQPVGKGEDGGGVNPAMNAFPHHSDSADRPVVACHGERNENRESQPAGQESRFSRVTQDPAELAYSLDVNPGVKRCIAESGDPEVATPAYQPSRPRQLGEQELQWCRGHGDDQQACGELASEMNDFSVERVADKVSNNRSYAGCAQE